MNEGKSATVELREIDPKKGSVCFRGGDRTKDVVASVYVNRCHPAIANASKGVRVTVEAIE